MTREEKRLFYAEKLADMEREWLDTGRNDHCVDVWLQCDELDEKKDQDFRRSWMEHFKPRRAVK